jgi:hypothetical protein
VKIIYLLFLLSAIVFSVQASGFSETFEDLPSMWKVGISLGARPNTYTMLSFPVAIDVGYIWPQLGFGIDLRGDFAGSTRGIGVINGSSLFLVPHEVRLSVVPRIGSGIQRTWIHAIFPVGVKLQPYDIENNRRHAVYINVGSGLGFIRPFDKIWFIQLEVSGFLGVRVNAETSWNQQIVPRIRGGGEVLVGFGLRQ